MTAHAKLSASGSKKWLTCTRSAKEEEAFPDEQSAFAAEGTFAHEVFELGLRYDIEQIDDAAYEARLAALRQNPLWSEELYEYVMQALAIASERIRDARAISPDAQVLIEQRLDFSLWVPEGFGTGDLVIIGDGFLEVLDLKYGKGVMVDAQDNSQMRLYALGAISEFGHLYEHGLVRMTILQPRLNNYSSDAITADELLTWGEEFVRPRAQLAWDGGGEFVPGEHCTSGFCKARFTCRARSEHAMVIAKQSFALVPPDQLTREQVVSVLDRADAAISWLNDVKAYALKSALEGHAIPGYKLVQGRAVRKYTDPDAIAAQLVASGIDEALIFERQLLGLTAMEKTLGKKKFNELVGHLIDKPPGKPTLVPEADKREPMQPTGFSVVAIEDRSSDGI